MTEYPQLPLMLYNTMSRRKELFEPIDPDRLYVCLWSNGVQQVHIGNARPVVVTILFKCCRSLSSGGVCRNITDIDDKIMTAAAELGEDISVLSQHMLRLLKIWSSSIILSRRHTLRHAAHSEMIL